MSNVSKIVLAAWAFSIGGLSDAFDAQASDCEVDSSRIAAHIFDMSDTNADDVLTHAEFVDAGLERYGATFDDFDLNKDGETSVDEFFDLFELHHSPQEAI